MQGVSLFSSQDRDRIDAGQAPYGLEVLAGARAGHWQITSSSSSSLSHINYLKDFKGLEYVQYHLDEAT